MYMYVCVRKCEYLANIMSSSSLLPLLVLVLVLVLAFITYNTCSYLDGKPKTKGRYQFQMADMSSALFFYT